VIDVSREPPEPENAKMAMRLARVRCPRVALRLAVQRALAPACPLTLSFLTPTTHLVLFFFLFFLFLSVPAPRIVGLLVLNVRYRRLLIRIGEIDAWPLAQAAL